MNRELQVNAEVVSAIIHIWSRAHESVIRIGLEENNKWTVSVRAMTSGSEYGLCA